MFSGIIFSAAPANAYADISIQGYRGSSGSFTAVSDGGTIPSGAQLDVKVWIDSAYGSIYIDWGDGTSDPVTGTSWAVTKYHTYSKDGTYTIKVNTLTMMKNLTNETTPFYYTTTTKKIIIKPADYDFKPELASFAQFKNRYALFWMIFLAMTITCFTTQY